MVWFLTIYCLLAELCFYCLLNSYLLLAELLFIALQGLVNAFVDNWPQYEHRICCRHLYNNLRKNHPGVLIRDLFWKAAKATYQQAWERAMNELKEVDEGAFKWLQSHSTTIWARSMFRSDGQSDTILNNICESFNSRILKFRSKPIITMVGNLLSFNTFSSLMIHRPMCIK